MLDPTTWGDEVVLSLASNLLEVDIIIIPTFRVWSEASDPCKAPVHPSVSFQGGEEEQDREQQHDEGHPKAREPEEPGQDH